MNYDSIDHVKAVSLHIQYNSSKNTKKEYSKYREIILNEEYKIRTASIQNVNIILILHGNIKYYINFGFMAWVSDMDISLGLV